jgi:hypothetical protein
MKVILYSISCFFYLIKNEHASFEILLLQECYMIFFGMSSFFTHTYSFYDICILINKVARPAHGVENLPRANQKNQNFQYNYHSFLL